MLSLAIPPPPPELVELIGGVMESGSFHARHLIRDAGLLPEHRILDVGCGIGRTAIPLTEYLSQRGDYQGFDVSAESIHWCRTEISSRYPNFNFTHVDVANAAYNQAGVVSPTDFRFPYPDAHFDVACLFSIFTHLCPPELEHYLSEIARTLKEGGRVMASFFVLTDERLAGARSLVEANPEMRELKALVDGRHGDYYSPFDPPEWGVAYEESIVRATFERNGLQVKEPIRFGNWSDWTQDGPAFAGTQDTVLAQR